ncbi:MAG: thiamine diphosphokinase, partial [Ruminococcaceae bacterium]|nr:thiamine diphosphokinase [Oscillospiraceae bacterium]
MRAVVICGGTVGEYILDYVNDTDYVICADSGYDRAAKYGIEPNIVIGDMDSIKSSYVGENVLVFPSKKDFTDSDLALKYAIDAGFCDILMFGMIGTRFDHSFANVSLLLNCKGKNVRIIDSNNIISMVWDEIVIKGAVGDTVSILPFSGDLEGVSTEGLEYSLSDSEVKLGTSLGVSNKMTE